MSIVIEGGSANTSFIYVCGVRMPALYRARIANVRVANGRQIVVEPILPGGGSVLLQADYLDFEINDLVIADHAADYTPEDVVNLLNDGDEDADFPGLSAGLSGGGGTAEIPDGSISTKKAGAPCSNHG